MKVAELEKSKDWQATAEDENGHRIAVMRVGEDKFLVWNGNWTGTTYPASLEYPQGLPVLSGMDVRTLFECEKLKLLKGEIPITD